MVIIRNLSSMLSNIIQIFFLRKKTRRGLQKRTLRQICSERVQYSTDATKMTRFVNNAAIITITYVISVVLAEDFLGPDCPTPCRCYWGKDRLKFTVSCRYTNSLREMPSNISRNATHIILIGDFSKIEMFYWSNWTTYCAHFL